jgi:hypothetical protein
MSLITLVTVVHNEEARIEPWLAHSVRWADKVLVFDKGSSDATRTIAQSYGASVVEIPFSGVGHEDWVAIVESLPTDWFVWSTPSEFITPNLARAFKYVATHDDGLIDCLAVRNKIYSFGHHNPRSDMGLHWVSKMFNRARIKVVNELHNYWQSQGKRRFLEDKDGRTHVLHLGQPSFAAYAKRTFDYAEHEAQGSNQELVNKAKKSLLRSEEQNFVFLQGGEGHDIRHALAWKASNLLTALACLDAIEQNATLDRYRELSRQYLAQWDISDPF